MGLHPIGRAIARSWSRRGALVDWFVPQRIRESDLGPRARMAAGIALLMVVVFVGLAITHMIARSYREAWANLALAVIMFTGPTFARLTGRYALSVNATLSAALLLVIFIGGTARGAGINAATVALAEFPLFATLLLGPRLGAGWLLLSCVVSGLLGLAGARGLVQNRVPAETQLFDDHVVLIVVTATLYIVAALYERGRAEGLKHIASLDAERRRAEVDKLQAQADARVAHAERLASLGSIAAATAHEINNPLSYVSNNLEFVRLQAGSVLDRDVHDALTEAQDGVHRIQSIVGDLKAFARPEAQIPESVSLHSAVATALKMAEGHTRAKARVETELEPVPQILATETRVVQVLLNLIVNAAHAIPDGPNEQSHRIIVRTRLEGDRVVTEVEDTGIGMPEDVLRRLGEPFFTTKDEGLGLGLAVCRYLVDSMGGELVFESRPGRTVARILLQANTAEIFDQRGSVTTVTRVLASVPPARIRVLVVDDDPLVARGIIRHLRTHEVVACNSGKAALNLLYSGEQFDLVLCDLMMPEVSGMDVHAGLIDDQPSVASKVVFMTGGTFTKRAQEFRARSSNIFLEKPIDLSRLSRLVTETAHSIALESGYSSQASSAGTSA